MQINLILKDKQLRFADEPTEWMITDNDDYILHIDIQDERQLAMFAVFTRDGEAVKCTIDEEGYVLDKDGNRSVPMWAMAFNKMTVGVIASGYASIPFEINVRGSIKRRYEEEIVPPDDPLIEQLIALVNNIEITGGGFPPVTSADNGKIAQVNQGVWTIQHPILGDESLHLLTNMEIENLLK